MSKATEANGQRGKPTVSLVASIILGVILLIAGTGKIFAFGEMPGQTMKFIIGIIPPTWLTPGLVIFLADIFFPYIMPWAEIGLGILLLLQIWLRLSAAISLPLITGFIVNNIWYISQGDMKFAPCPCWGIWGTLLGTPTHLQSLCIDIILLALALTVIFVHPGGFLSSPSWLARLGQGAKRKDKQK